MWSALLPRKGHLALALQRPFRLATTTCMSAHLRMIRSATRWRMLPVWRLVVIRFLASRLLALLIVRELVN